MREIWYVAHPVRGLSTDPTVAREEVQANMANVKAWLRYFFYHDPERVYIAPWVAEVEAFLETGNDADVGIVKKALEDDCVVVTRLDGFVMVGGRVSSGMAQELEAAKKSGSYIRDWSKYVTPADIGTVPL